MIHCQLRPIGALFQCHFQFGRRALVSRAFLPVASLRGMKRKAASELTSKVKRPKELETEPKKDYCDVAPQINSAGDIVWPAPAQAIESARSFLKNW